MSDLKTLIQDLIAKNEPQAKVTVSGYLLAAAQRVRQELSTAKGTAVQEATGDLHLKQLVHDALDNSKDNGYAPEKQNSTELADDLLMYDADLDGFKADDLLPHIESWKKAQVK